MQSKNQEAFFALVRAGLWEQDVELRNYGTTDFSEILRLAEEQSVVGLVAAGLEHVKDVKVPQEWALQFIGQTLQIEQRNKAMNYFIGVMTDKMREAGIYTVLVKGQGVAQCYERPLWRACGDVDLLLNAENYERAKTFLIPQADEVEREFSYLKHIGMTFGGWELELHGHFRSRLSKRIDDELDGLFDRCMNVGEVRVWHNDATDVYLPAPDIDVLFSFTHMLRHFYFEGVGLRQICDWCRLLYRYRGELDLRVLESRIRKMGLMSEWKAFAAFAVKWLGIPVEAMPLFNDNDNANENLKRKADRICRFVMKVGNFGHNEELRAKSRRTKGRESYFWRKFKSFWGRLRDMLRHFRIFPLDSIRFFGGVIRSGLHAAVRGE